MIRLRDHFTPEARDQLMQHLQAEGIECAPYFPSIHLQPYYRRRFGFKPGDFPNCEALSARTLALPFFTALTRDDVQYVATMLERFLPSLPGKTPTVAVSSADISS